MLLCVWMLTTVAAFSQNNPVITSWLRNNTGIKGRHYVAGNSTPVNDPYPANVQSVKYSANWVYVTCSGIPSYIIGPYLDGNPSQGANQNNIYKIPLAPVKNNGTPAPTTPGNIGAFINGVALFDYRDGVSYNINTGSNQGGPLGGMGNGVWNRDAVVAERAGFDCSKGHPAMGNYHHHQNPSAFKFDLQVISNVCNLYTADGLYVIDSTAHAPLLGFAYDGFPIYGAYGYKNTDGTGGIVRMKSSYALRNITVRTHYANGTDVTDGPPVNATYPLGLYREDYQYNPTSSATPDYLDEHNGRFCVTPEYPNGIYCYFTTVDANWNSAYPYAVGPTFYGVKNVTRVQTINETTTTYNGPPLTASSITTDIGCFGAANGAINLTVHGGNPPYTYVWENGATMPHRSGLTPGTYTVTITDVTAQTVVHSAVITQPAAAIVVQANATPVSCHGDITGLVNLSVTGGAGPFTYLWNTGDTTQHLLQVGAGVYEATISDSHLCVSTVSATVTQPASALVADIHTTPVKCFGEPTGAIGLTLSGGTPGYSVVWNDGSLSPERQAIGAGIYSATVTDASGCSTTLSEIVQQPAEALAAQILTSNVDCFGQSTGSIQVTASGGVSPYALLWNDGNTDPTRTALPVGIYTVIATDANQCTLVLTGTVAEPAAISATTTVLSATCGANNGALSLTGSGGTPPLAFSWSNGATGSNAAQLPSGAYTVTITDANGCTATITDAVSNTDGPEITAAPVPVLCHGQATGTIILQVTSGVGPFQFLWNDSYTVQNRTNLVAGMYAVTVLDANQCAAVATISLAEPAALTVTGVTTPETCSLGNGAIAIAPEGGSADYSYSWSNGATTQNLQQLTSGNYTLTLVDANGCSLEYSTVVPAQASPVAVLTAEDVRCFNESNGSIQVALQGGTPPFSFHWSNGFTNQNAENLSIGNYAVTVTDANGCSATGNQMVQGPSQPLIIGGEVQQVRCYGESTGSIVPFVTGNDGSYVLNWNGNTGSVSLDALAAGQYTLTATTPTGCTATFSATITQPDAPLALTTSAVNATLGDDGSITTQSTGGTPPYGYTWSNGFTGAQLSNLPPGTYSVTLTDANGCTTSTSTAVSLNVSGTEELENLGLKIFPNPASEFLLVQAQSLLQHSIYLKLSNITGQVVGQQEFFQGSTLCIFETTTLYDGLYFLTVQDGVITKTFQVVINR